MRLEAFFEKFELFADAPNAVGKMRELVRHLAVTGKLVPQYPEDESAIALLSRIAAHKTTLSKKGKLRGPTTVTPMTSEEGDFDIPPSWVWVRFGEVMVNRDGERIPVSKEERATKAKAYDYYGASGVIDKIDHYLFDKPLLLIGEDGANLVNRSTPIAFMARGRYWVNNHAHVLDGISEDFLRYIELHINAINLEPYVTGSAQPKMNQAKMNSIPIALPPLAEQNRIVAKVDELMALCDRLEAQQQERDTRHATLAHASLTRFAEAPTPANLDFLFHQSYPITPADLRKAILSLAVQGKLVAQDPNDEPAECLIQRVTATRRSVSAKMFRPVDVDECPYDIPESWAWTRLGNISLKSDSGWSPQCNSERRTGTDWAVLKVSAVSWGVFQPEENKALPPGMAERPECEVQAGDFLLSRANTAELVARSVIVDQTPPHLMMSDKIVRFIFPDEVEKPFINLANSSDFARAYYARNASGTSSSMKNIGRDVMCNLPVPLPPLAEQRGIVAKVDQLMAMVDQLEAQLAEAKIRSTALLDAVIHELLNPSAEIVDLAAYRAAIGCYAVRKMQDKPYFGRTAAAKVLYLAQAHVGLELGLKPLRDAAGPLDPWIYDFEKKGAREDWFRVSEGNTASGNKKITYQPGRKLAEQCAHAGRLLSDKQRNEFDRLLGLLGDKTTDEVEIIATLFAAWNDFLIDGRSPSDEQIVTEVREHWHQRKARFTPTVLRQWLAWLRQNNLVPTGRPPRTVHQPQLLLN
ncbi:MAG: restriction endonuclease subunit S [Sulfuritalea sp.]|nr:restriction endonuclease subunit S [Sulfuritalea sp.]